MTAYRSSFLTAALLGVSLMSAPLVSTPVAQATCQQDPVTGICWTTQQLGNRGNPSSIGGTANCSPGRLGLCLGAAQNGVTPGANLKPQAPAGPAPRSWP